MRLGLLYGFSHSHDSLNLVLEAERLGFDSVWTGEAWGSDTIMPLAWVGALTKKIRLGTGDHADAGAHARDDGDDRDDAGRDVGRTLHPRRRAVGAAGGRRMARSAVRQAAACATASTSRSCARFSRARRRWNSRATSTRSRTAAPARPGLGKPLRPILHGRRDMEIYMASISAKRGRARGRNRRRRDSGLDEPGAMGPVHAEPRARIQEGRRRARSRTNSTSRRS